MLNTGNRLSRRRFIQLTGISAASAWLAACSTAVPAAAPAAETGGDSAAPATGGDAAEINIEYMMGDAELTPPELSNSKRRIRASPSRALNRMPPSISPPLRQVHHLTSSACKRLNSRSSSPVTSR